MNFPSKILKSLCKDTGSYKELEDLARDVNPFYLWLSATGGGGAPQNDSCPPLKGFCPPKNF